MSASTTTSSDIRNRLPRRVSAAMDQHHNSEISSSKEGLQEMKYEEIGAGDSALVMSVEEMSRSLSKLQEIRNQEKAGKSFEDILDSLLEDEPKDKESNKNNKEQDETLEPPEEETQTDKDISRLFDETFKGTLSTRFFGFGVPFDALHILGFSLALICILHNKARWILREWYLTGEGHSVSKLLVVLFLLYIYSFINWGLEVIGTADYVMEMYFPQHYKKMKDFFQSLGTKYATFQRFGNMSGLKAFSTPFISIFGCMVWDIVWKYLVCKSHHDRTCTKNWIGKTLWDYRNDVCYDGKASFAICEKFIAFIPLILLTCFTVILGNVINPLINDRMGSILCYKRVKDAEVLLDSVQRNIMKKFKSKKAPVSKEDIGDKLSNVLDTTELASESFENTTPVFNSTFQNDSGIVDSSIGLNTGFYDQSISGSQPNQPSTEL